ncbi:hypothetical protein GUY44_12020 [Pimelobacter simplex]|uniref:Uncharacterized protein n=1 Tax=Nocardioides simplex TaxID=2045 RepID=A0A0A1DHP4_NOCSI|nr:hypothetical protein [Pimelobacter simplex]AIY16152.3 hypothetical protein KR76_04150 [Pimelobacter simplex]MCG8151209.1 hypothetical protein [Pimelobacter simplex]GEB17197.1 hypothetical protein NSI01_55120 [Pimelobacter simplex]SFN18906.1 hypothetical protein SAMN05421671_0025 [Pimelobacter simplex]
MTASTDLDDTLANIRARAEAATPGPWAWEAVGEKDNGWCLGVVWDDNDQPLTGRIQEGSGTIIDAVCENVGASHFADAEFIAHAPADIELLLTLHDRVTADRDRLRDRERWFAINIPVADGGQYRNDWPGAIENLVHQRDEIQANRDALAHKVAEQRAVIARVREFADHLESLGTTSVYESAAEIGQMIRAALDGADTTTTDGDAVHEGDTHA